MDKELKFLNSLLLTDDHFSEDQKAGIESSLKQIGKQLEILQFKLDRTEKVKRTTSILLEETIAELELKRKAIEDSNAALKRSLDELKSAQAQLIHAEKMASLGELTAGIAHEIQNPLNFVNNFSEVSNELITDLLEERAKPENERDKNLEAELLADLESNLEKIEHHGKRASDIVKSMLQHSRSSDGQKEPTNINALCDEYLRLAYHGMRARDKSLNAKYETDFDPELPEINIVPQDIGRVLLNLINNGFQAIADVDKPQLIVKTERAPTLKEGLGGVQRGVLISVSDNGSGIPDSIKDKIFQPFFTTKPTGQGTGLGLSLSYDIVKAHGGDLKLESVDGRGTTFVILLPIN